MSMTPSERTGEAIESPTELLQRREQLQEWLKRLDELDDIPAQVARRVRADYEQRLQAVVDELGAHRDQLASDRQRLDERLLEAAERHDGAADTLEEVRLRHRIGELTAEEWEDRRPGLEGELEAAAAERAEIEREIVALDELLGQIGAATPVDDPHAADGWALGGDAGFAEAADEWSPLLPDNDFDDSVSDAITAEAVDEEETIEAFDVGRLAPETTEEEHATLDIAATDELGEITSFADEAEALADRVDRPAPDDDIAFLEELDRTIAATAPRGPARDDEAPEETRPQPGLKCPECGYSNDPAAWYCGVCGVDLG